MRGKRVHFALRVKHVGLIPAGAGKTPRESASSVCSSAHPRWCGENLVMGEPTTVDRGSSPLVRGKLKKLAESAATSGLIPAGAGKTVKEMPGKIKETAHPRWCGENSHEPTAPQGQKGSSPLVRGKLFQKDLTKWQMGLIPAGAGKTGNLLCPNIPLRAHPRWCGENSVRRRM